MKTLYARNYEKLMKLAPELWNLTQGDALKSESAGFLDLHLDLLSLDPKRDEIIIALAHYYKCPADDLIPDPEMRIRVNRSTGVAEAFIYQDSFYNLIYISDDVFNPYDKKKINRFLGRWLGYCLDQGHKLQVLNDEGK
jgi:uncharacterized protein YqiB (DUF1249 family)